MNQERMQADKEFRSDMLSHRYKVEKLIDAFCDRLKVRAKIHDLTKFDHDEYDTFVIYSAKLKRMKYGSDEYKQALKEMGPALGAHYRKNRHHPEFHAGGVSGMSLVDLVEMVIDWKASTLRMKDGDFKRSIEMQCDRFDLSPQLFSILMNSVGLFALLEAETETEV